MEKSGKPKKLRFRKWRSVISFLLFLLFLVSTAPLRKPLHLGDKKQTFVNLAALEIKCYTTTTTTSLLWIFHFTFTKQPSVEKCGFSIILLIRFQCSWSLLCARHCSGCFVWLFSSYKDTLKWKPFLAPLYKWRNLIPQRLRNLLKNKLIVSGRAGTHPGAVTAPSLSS